MTAWGVVLRHPVTGNELALEGWTSIQVTENFEGASATIEVPGNRAELSFVTELVTNILLYSNKALAYQMRIMDAEDMFTAEGHTVSLQASSYEAILSRRVLFKDYDQPATDQHEIAWWFVNYTQAIETLRIAKATNWAASGVLQDRIIQKGKTITEAINEVASVENGFDWWIDQNLRFHAQTPKKLFDTGLDLVWGAMVDTVTRSSASDTYDSVVYVTGATNETQLEGTAINVSSNSAYLVNPAQYANLTVLKNHTTHGDGDYTGKKFEVGEHVVLGDQSKAWYNPDVWVEGWRPTVYPPPPPAIRALTSRPYGRWERAWTYGDLVTKASVIDKANWHLADASARRATYRIGLRPGVWNQTIRPGGLLSLRIKSPPRLNLRVRCRIEEISLSIGASGEEIVELGTRGETTETVIAGPLSDVGISTLANPADEVEVTPGPPTGLSQTVARVSEMDKLASLMRDFEERISRSELH